MFEIPNWTYEFHGHHCPFMPIGYRMGKLALDTLGVEREKDHRMFIYSEMGVGHPQTCLMDGLQAATGCTYGKLMIERLNYGKVAAIVYHPQKGAIRLAVRPEFIDALGQFEFFDYRKRGVEPSQIPESVSRQAIEFVLTAGDDELFKLEPRPDFRYQRVPGSFAKDKCAQCGEYVFERYLRLKAGQVVCIPCSEAE